jgi:lipoyl synthase
MATAPNPIQTDLIQIDLAPKRPVSKPDWLKARAPVGDN